MLMVTINLIIVNGQQEKNKQEIEEVIIFINIKERLNVFMNLQKNIISMLKLYKEDC